MSCAAPERLSALLEGELSASQSEALRSHAAGCARCSGLLADLSAMVATTRSLEPPEPPPTLWAAVEGSLESRERTGWLSWASWRPFAVGALAGAFAVAVGLLAVPSTRGRLTGGADVAAPNRTPAPSVVATAAGGAAVAATDPLLDEAEAEFARAAAAYEHSIEKLRTLLARAEAGWSPEQRALVAERLARLDDAIARSREPARRTPGDSVGNEQLFAAYQQKIAFLAEAVHRGGEWNERAR